MHNNQLMNSLDSTFVSSGSSHCPLLNLRCDLFNYTDSSNFYQCIGNKGMEVRILSFYIF